MPHHDHQLYAEFPAEHAVIEKLKTADARFRRDAERYEETGRKIAQIEAGLAAAADDRLEDLKKVRLALLDELYERITLEKVG